MLLLKSEQKIRKVGLLFCQMNKIKAFLLTAGVLSSAALIPQAFAQAGQCVGSQCPGATQISSPQAVLDLVKRLLGWAYAFFYVATAFFILWAAFDYLTAGGDTKKLDAAKSKLIYAIVALIIALVATGFQSFASSLLTQQA
ncbi:MAG: hypothetical protein KGL39_16035 [Patescibacteria group bacterium]|nr:hypothetical protein [Patescibacteria group bacterium]